MRLPHPEPLPPGPGQESVWNYPRPAVAESTDRRLVVRFDGQVLADTRNGVRTLETSHPPTYYFPATDVDTARLQPNAAQRSLCEWKGAARYFDIVSGGHRATAACWSYPSPTPTFLILRDHIAFYPALMEQCLVDGETVVPQPGHFYGGWVTSHVAGPFKGAAGSNLW